MYLKLEHTEVLSDDQRVEKILLELIGLIRDSKLDLECAIAKPASEVPASFKLASNRFKLRAAELIPHARSAKFMADDRDLRKLLEDYVNPIEYWSKAFEPISRLMNPKITRHDKAHLSAEDLACYQSNFVADGIKAAQERLSEFKEMFSRFETETLTVRRNK